MAEATNIEWCDSTFNPWIGCTKISPGCDNCYAERSTPARTKGIVWGINGGPLLTGDDNWRKPVQWNKAHEKFFASQGRRRRVFCASLADVFDNRAPDVFRTRLWNLIADTPNLDWLLLTKRIGNALDMLPAFWCMGYEGMHVWNKAFKHVSIGISVVNQAEADRDIPKLLQVPATRRFLSIEPMLGSVDLARWLARCDHGSVPGPGGVGGVTCAECDGAGHGCMSLHWVICGGESGPRARPMHPDWARSLRDQCATAGVPVFFKQWGEWAHVGASGAASCGEPHLYGDGCVSWKVGKKAAGAMLDGREHKAWPAQ